MIRVYSPDQHIEQTYQQIQSLLRNNLNLSDEEEERLNHQIRNYHLLTDDLRKNNKDNLPKTEIIIRRKVPTIDFLKKFLIEIRSFYFNAQGNHGIFIRQIRKFNSTYDLIFNILIGFDFPIDNLITFSHWDSLVIKLIVGWCLSHGKQIHISTLFQIVDQINGDQPWVPPRVESKKWTGPPPPPPPGLKRVDKTYDLMRN